MKLSLLMLSALFLSGLAHAESRPYACETSDEILNYGFEIKLGEDGHALFKATLSGKNASDGIFTCVSNDATYTQAQDEVRLAGTLRCQDGSQGTFERTLDVKRLVLIGGWQGPIACRVAE